MSPGSRQVEQVGPHPALIELAAGRGLPKVSDPMPMLRSAFDHGMAGLLLTEVEETDQPWRRLVLGLLRARNASVEAWHKRLWSGIESIARILDELGVEVAIAKGIAAEARWYSRLGERPCSDLDLLLSPAHLSRIDDIIAAVEPSHPLCGKTRNLAEQGFLQSIDLKRDGVPIDLHWDILKIGIPSRNRDAIWERTVPFALPNTSSVRMLDPESSYVHFLVHLNKDRFRRLLGFVDVARVHALEELDGDAVERLVRTDGINTSVDESWNVVVDTLQLAAPRRQSTPGIRAVIWRLAWPPPVRLLAAESRIRFRHRQYLIALLIPGRTTEAVTSWLRGRFPPAELLAYVHSKRQPWGGEPVTGTQHTMMWSLTVGRVKAWFGRRRGVAKVRGVRGLKPNKLR
ncbi:MAG TPA: nucleotidyltransferase family protein, partial [Propionibacteriaceae bacterium]|nr:nucleotidyltransferase family protein [Propionibacteriaceae bacterium]